MRERKVELEREVSSPLFWSSPSREETLKLLSETCSRLEEIGSIERGMEDISILTGLLEDEFDEDISEEFGCLNEELTRRIDAVNWSLLMSGEYDRSNAILTLHSGAGGLDAQDWGGIMMRMYIRFAERRHFGVQVLDVAKDFEGGIKYAVLMIDGLYAYGSLRSEGGYTPAFCWVRISPFDSSYRRPNLALRAL